MNTPEEEANNILNNLYHTPSEIAAYEEYPIMIHGGNTVQNNFDIFKFSVFAEFLFAAKSLEKNIQNNNTEPLDDIDKRIDEKVLFLRDGIDTKQSNVESLVLNERAQLIDAVRSAESTFTVYLNSHAPEYIKSLKESSDNPHSWLKWLEYSASDEQIINFFDWHVYSVMESQNDPETNELFEKIQNDFAGMVESGVQQGWISKNNIYSKDDSYIDMHIDSPFRYIVHGSIGGYIPEQDYIKVAPLAQIPRSKEGFEHLVVHELIHARLDPFLANQRSEGNLVKKNFNDPSDDPFDDSWLREATTEHMATVFRSGNPEVFDPADVRRKGGYDQWRNILHLFLENGNQRINPMVLTRAMTGNEEEKKLFYDAMDESWGVHNFIGQISQYVSEKNKEYGIGRSHVGYVSRIDAVSNKLRDDFLNHPERIFE